MKLNKIKIFAVAGILILSAGACKKSFFTSVNKNPNAVDFVNPNLLLPSCEIALGFTQGGDFSRYSSLLTQQAFGAQNQTATFYKYGINPGTFENGWGDMYTSTMENIFALKYGCDSIGFYHAYAGVARILLAYCLQVTVDDWGDIPYSAALRGKLDPYHLQPKYDKAADLYDSIAKLVDDGIALFGTTGNDLAVPGTEDVMYNGDLSLWAKFGHAIKARLYIHQSKGNPAMATSALAEIASSFASSKENAVYNFTGTGTTNNPWAQFMNDRAGYITFNDSSFLINSMINKTDPRVNLYGDTVKKDGGILGPYYGSATSPVEFITMDELLFMKAEATLRSGGTIAAAQGYYRAAIDSNMTKLGVAPADIATYLAAHGTLPGTTDAAIAQVGAEEYIALFLNPEAWTLYRRTGVPNIPAQGGNGVPRRLIYPQSEYSYNGANTPQSTLYTPQIFWDK
ncbi:MAG: SusD/RagB family nutrient-binding outer membrane lipoprotein [Chitinophagaceae bacterium]|nr:SusD/RagB family nutrient-binding outer membrane lipoprotein [Chitinophagaceae bacterium]